MLNTIQSCQETVGEIIEKVSPSFHSSGALYPDVLWKIVEEHGIAKAHVSAETGCGLSTLILSHLSERHTAFTLHHGDSLLFLRCTEDDKLFELVQDYKEAVVASTHGCLDQFAHRASTYLPRRPKCGDQCCLCIL